MAAAAGPKRHPPTRPAAGRLSVGLACRWARSWAYNTSTAHHDSSFRRAGQVVAGEACPVPATSNRAQRCHTPTLTSRPRLTYAARSCVLKMGITIQRRSSMSQNTQPSKTNPSRRACRGEGEPIANVLMAKTLAQPDLISLAAAFVDHQSLPIEPTRQAFEALWSDPRVGPGRIAIRHYHRASAAAATGGARADAGGRRPHRPGVERLGRSGRHHPGQQPVAVPVGREPSGPRRHRPLHVSQLFCGFGYPNQSRGSCNRCRDGLPGDRARGARAGACPA